MKKQYYLFLFVVICQSVWSQDKLNCQHPDPNKEVLKTMRGLQNAQQKTSVKRIFPVVFHVLHVGGNENIDDAQIFDAMINLNEDFQKLNADTVDVVSPFDTIIGNPNFEFRLATIDPNGNPTNGIDRIYTQLAVNATENSKINVWDPTKYINIWVVKSIGQSGVAALTTNPLVLPINTCSPGVMILNDYVGTIGTGFSAIQHSLTHEMSHFFGMFHLSQTFGSPGGSSCSYSDGIYDTPQQTSLYSCNFSENTCNDSLDMQSFSYWGYDVQDMVQNFLTQTYCSRFFTKGQAAMMRAIQENPMYGRLSLSDSLNLIATGVANGMNPLNFPPSAAFSLEYYNPNSNNASTYDLFCAGTSVQFTIQNGNPGNTTYLWSFLGGFPSTDTTINPTVSYAQPGFYNVSLTATNANGTNAETKNSVIYVSGNWAEYAGPTQLDFDNNGDFWLQYNRSNDSNKFTWIPDLGQNNSGCFCVKSRFNPDTTGLCWQLSEDQIQENKYDLISPAFDLRNTTSVSISFDYAHGSSTTTFPGVETIRLLSSRDCGRSWTQRIMKLDTAFVTSYITSGNEYVPVASEWRTITVPYLSSSLDNKTRIKIEYTSSNESNYVYIDNFRIDGVLGISESYDDAPQVYPNPVGEGGLLQVQNLKAGNYTFEIIDLQGKVVFTKTVIVDGEDQTTFNPETRKGCYLLRIDGPTGQFIQRIIIQ